MKAIWKYEIEATDRLQVISMPMGAAIIKVEGGFFWAIVDPHITSVEERVFVVHGTGHEVTDHKNKRYVGTWFQGLFVWHLFELN